MKMLILFHSMYGHIRTMAEAAAQAAREIPGVEALLRRVPETLNDDILTKMGALDAAKAQADIPVATVNDLAEADAILFGTPTRFGNMAAPLKYFLDTTGALWVKGTLAGKPAAVFTSTASLHGGQETTLTSMMLPLLHHGMLIVGLPYTLAEVNRTASGGTPYGASHWAGPNDEKPLTDDERALCIALGKRLAETTVKLAA